jgi:superfamily II DNA/RNA helicase
MLDMGFESQIKEIVQERGMPSKEERQTLMFSATFPEECQKMAQSFMFDYIWIGVGTVGGAVTTVTQKLVKVHPQKKYEQLIEVLDKFYADRESNVVAKNARCLVFVNAKDTAKWLDEQLYEKHYDTGALHGNLTQFEREHNLKRYRQGDIDVMLATDVAARGLDIENVDLVLNYDLPKEIDTYVHRIGRSGRIGNRGNALTFIATDENGKAYEDEGVMQKLLNIMRDANADVPTWLEEEVESKDTWAAHGTQSKDSWGDWDSKDMRGGWQ